MHAVNFVRYGPLASGFAAILNTGQVEPKNWVLYAHHPPLIPFLIAGVYALFGISEWSTRLIPVFFTLASTALLYLIALRRFGPFVAFWAGFFYSCVPITVAFGGMPDYVNTQVVFFMLVVIETYLRWYETRQQLWLCTLSLSALLGALSDWPIFFPGVVLYGHFLLRCPELSFKAKLVPGLIMSLLFLSLIVWAESAGQGRSILDAIYARTIAGTDPGDLAKQMHAIITYNIVELHTSAVSLLALVFIGMVIFNHLTRNWTQILRYEAPILLTITAALYLIFALTGNFQHPWWSVLVTAPVSLAAALSVWALRNLTNQSVIRLLIPLGIGALFLNLSIPAAYDEISMRWKHARTDAYTLKELGAVIKSISRPDEGVLSSDMSWDPTLWFYSDRQLRPAVNTITKLNESLGPGPYPLRDWYSQPDGPPPRWFVMPPHHRATFQELADELDARFSRYDLNGYWVYRLF